MESPLLPEFGGFVLPEWLLGLDCKQESVLINTETLKLENYTRVIQTFPVLSKDLGQSRVCVLGKGAGIAKL